MSRFYMAERVIWCSLLQALPMCPHASAFGAYTATRTLRNGTRGPVRLGPDNQHGGESASLVFKPHETSLPCGSATTDNGVDRAFLTVMSP